MNNVLYDRVMKVKTLVYDQLTSVNERLEFYDAVEHAKDFDDLPPWTREIILNAERSRSSLLGRYGSDNRQG